MQQGLQARRPTSLQAYGPVLIITLFSSSKSLFSHPPLPRPSSCQHLITTKKNLAARQQSKTEMFGGDGY